ncbi:MAG: hypothetical protein ABIS45_16955 [Burkholderiales bacterium]
MRCSRSADWQQQIKRCHDELGFRYVRFHGILGDDMGTLIAHEEKPLYSFFNADCICDYLRSIGMRPVVELGFMPEMLASGREIVFHYRGNVTPPADYGACGTLICKLITHWVERYATAWQRCASGSSKSGTSPICRNFLDRHAGRLLRALRSHRARKSKPSTRRGASAARRRRPSGLRGNLITGAAKPTIALRNRSPTAAALSEEVM